MEKYVKYIPLFFFCAVALKCLATGSTAIDASVLLILGATAAFWEFKNQDKASTLLHKRLDEVDKHLSALYKLSHEAKNDVALVRTAQQLNTRSFTGSGLGNIGQSMGGRQG